MKPDKALEEQTRIYLEDHFDEDVPYSSALAAYKAGANSQQHLRDENELLSKELEQVKKQGSNFCGYCDFKGEVETEMINRLEWADALEICVRDLFKWVDHSKTSALLLIQIEDVHKRFCKYRNKLQSETQRGGL